MTDSWLTCNLGDAMLAGELLEQIRTYFLSCTTADNAAQDMAAFVRHESEGRLHCEVHVYFSPAAVEIAKAFGASPCAKPSSADLGLLAGSEASRTVLFPGS